MKTKMNAGTIGLAQSSLMVAARWGLLAMLVLLSGCGKGTEKVGAATAPVAAGEERLADGTVVIPTDSPKLKEIHVIEVKSASVPFDEVTSPGKIETNPNLVSRVALPLAGRVSGVMVKLGDSVKRGDPLLTLESPDADAGVVRLSAGASDDHASQSESE